MDLIEVSQIVADTPWMSLEQALHLQNFIREYEVKDILELGFKHGVSTCYMAAALSNTKGGSIVTIDLETAKGNNPNIEWLLNKCGYSQLVKIYYEPTSYIWRLMKFLQESQIPRFDFCYIDAAHTWFVDGFGFFLVDRLLRVGGWVIFDDLSWTHADSPAQRYLDRVKVMPQDERESPQIGLVYELLVKPHPSYGHFQIHGDWGYARKIK